jgi:predicted dithiol-disulfide oxidoreductase (DUF899 family)
MYGPERETPCRGCTHLLDGLDGAMRHVGQRASLYVVAKSPLAGLVAWARDRRWDHLQFLSTAGNTYDADYFGDTSRFSTEMRQQHGLPDGEDWDETIVFRREGGRVRHFWGSEMSFAKSPPGQHHRSGDFANPLWGLLDITPEGRGDVFPRLSYE